MFKAKCIKPYMIKYSWMYFIAMIWIIIVDLLTAYIPRVIGEVTDGLTGGTYGQGEITQVIKNLVLCGLVLCVGRFVWRYFLFGTARKIEYNLRNDFFSHLEKLSLSYFNQNKTGDLMAYATNDLNAIRMAVGPGILMALDLVILTTIVVYKMINEINLGLTLLAIIPLPIIAVSALILGKHIRVRFKDKQEAFAKMTDQVQENISGIRVIKAFIQEHEEMKAFDEKNKLNYSKNIRLVKLFAFMHPLVGIVAGLSILIVVGYGGYITMLGRISLGNFVTFIQYIMMLVWPMIALGWCINIFSQGNASVQRFQEVLDVEPEIFDEDTVVDMENIKGNIDFNNLTFSYPNSDTNALEGIDIKIKQGQTIGIVGRTGSGKTSLVNLLLRLFNPQRGELIIDGVDILDIPLKALRNSIGYVPQDNFLFSDTIENNIMFGVDNADSNDVVEAAKMANVHENIIEFPEKYETIVGERGVTLSGGQKQRVSIARALIKKPPVLILDDAVSAVDTHTEEKILGHLKEVRQDKTTIIIAHRISTIQHSDTILVVDEGRIIEQGQHDELVACNGLYAEMVEKQKLEQELEEA